jgi:hypothetical protein
MMSGKEAPISPHTAAAVERWRVELLAEVYSMLQNMVIATLPFK